MSSILYRTLSFFVLAAFLAGAAYIFLDFRGLLAYPDTYRFFTGSAKENITPGEPLVQKFTADENNLSQINIRMRNLDAIYPGETLAITLRDPDCHEVIRTAELAKRASPPEQLEHYVFEPIPDSQGKTYCLHILYTAQEKRKTRPGVAKIKNTGNPEDTFTKIRSDSEKVYSEETLAFRPAYQKNSSGEAIAELARRMSAYKAGFLKAPALYFIFGAFLLSTLTLAAALLLRKNE